MDNYGTAQPLLAVFWSYVVNPAFHIVQNAQFAGTTLLAILVGFFFIRLAYRYIILPIVGSGDNLNSGTDSINQSINNTEAEVQRKRQEYERDRQNRERRDRKKRR